MAKKNVFVIGLNDFYLDMLKTVRGAEDIAFHGLIDLEKVYAPGRFDIREIMREAERTLDSFDGTIDGIINYWDFPSSTVVPILQNKHNRRGADLEHVLMCEHKYWSRVKQAEVVPENVPRFAGVDPFADDVAAQVAHLRRPFWLKPIKAHSSHLGFRVESDADLDHAIQEIRPQIGRFGEPFNRILDEADIPQTFRQVGGMHCIAEEIIDGRQCTLEGYVFQGDLRVYGVIDTTSVASSLTSYRYPSSLPRPVQNRMVTIAKTVMEHIGFNNSPFNIEFFWDEAADQIWLLEVNPRISKSHCPEFWMVEGHSHQEVAVDIALDRHPTFPHGEGKFAKGAKFMVRTFDHADGLVKATPSADEIARVKATFPEALIDVDVKAGRRLSEHRNQDSYSYQLAEIFLGGEDDADVQRKYDRVLEMLTFDIAPIDT